MSIKKKYPKAEPKKHGSNNIYIDAALEAMTQAREENPKLSYLLLVHDNETCGVEMAGDVCSLSAALSHFSKTDEGLRLLVQLAAQAMFGLKPNLFPDSLEEILDKSEKLIDGYLDELKKNRPEDSK